EREKVGLDDLIDSIEGIKAARINVTRDFEELTPEEKERSKKKVKDAIAQKNQEAE
ncbi:MAG: hypothetical protein F6K35_19960, partial [Okeania sp. SIO2H7]|nr:hypothetical protein [Okeania sp. SIO2H7]